MSSVGFYPFKTARKRMQKVRIVRKKRNKQSWFSYIRKVLKDVHEHIGIDRAALQVMEDMMSHVFRMIAAEAQHLVQMSKRRTMMVGDVQTAVKLLLPGALKTHAHQLALKSVIQSRLRV